MNSSSMSFVYLRTLKSSVLVLIPIFMFILFAPIVATAEPLVLTISPTSLTAIPGGTVTFRGTIVNNTGIGINATDLFLNFGNFDPSLVTTAQILGNPDFFLANGSSTSLVELFSVTLAPAALVGSNFAVDVFLQDINNNFSNTATVNVSAVPEPSAMLLLGTGLVSLISLRRRRVLPQRQKISLAEWRYRSGSSQSKV